MQKNYLAPACQILLPKELIIIVADNSGTFYGAAEETNIAIRSLTHFIDQQRYRVSHITFGCHAYLIKKATLPNHLVPALDGTDGGTRLGPALGIAEAEIYRFKKLVGEHGATSLILISDGNICDLKAALPIATAIQKTDARLFTVATGSQPNFPVMESLATAPDYAFSSEPRQLRSLFEQFRRYFPSS